jgi:hypothetical protein
VAEGRVAVVGEALVLIEPGDVTPHSRPLAERGVSCALSGGFIVIATQRSLLRGESANDAPASWITDFGAETLAAAGGRLWARRSTELFLVDERSRATRIVRRGVLAMGSSAGTVHILVEEDDRALALLRLRGDDGDWERTALPGVARLLVDGAAQAKPGGGIHLAIGPAGHVALLGGGRLAVSRDGGVTLALSPLTHVLAATFRGDGPRAEPLVLTGSEPDARSSAGVSHTSPATLGKVGAAGALEELARIKMGGRGVGPVSIAWDASRDVVFVVGASGLTAVGPRLRH